MAEPQSRPLGHGIYINHREPRLFRKTALLRELNPHFNTVLAQFDDTELPEAYGWIKLRLLDFDFSGSLTQPLNGPRFKAMFTGFTPNDPRREDPGALTLPGKRVWLRPLTVGWCNTDFPVLAKFLRRDLVPARWSTWRTFSSRAFTGLDGKMLRYTEKGEFSHVDG
jgi:hypothetical protein